MSDLLRKKSISKIVADAAKGYSDVEEQKMNRILGVKDITLFGLAAIIGAGIFTSVGLACYDGGPAVILLFIGIAITCGLAALCYAEMASRLPVSGSAYTYAYATFGELIAWIIGWDLIMEYAVGNVTVAISWSGNLITFLSGLGIHLPDYLTHGYLEAYNGYSAVQQSITNHMVPSEFHQHMADIYTSAPHFMGMPLIVNIPAFAITAVMTILVYIGIKESKNAANFMVGFKLFVVIMIIIIGAFYVNTDNWNPFAPNGVSGVLKGVAAVFFAYIGFDALATVAEECKDPQRDLPRGMLYSLLIATVLYILIALVLTGMVSYTLLNKEAFLANTFIQRGLHWMGGVIAFSALIATASVFLVFQIGQPRIWMSMSRDGLLPSRFGKINPKYKTPSYATVIAGIVVGVPALFMDAAFVTDMCSIGTLFAFAIVCGGVAVLQYKGGDMPAKFKVPYISGQYIFPILVILIFVLFYNQKNEVGSYFYQLIHPENGVWEHLPAYLFLISLPILTVLSFRYKLSLIPMLGMICCMYLLSTLGHINWYRFIIWLMIGLVVYFAYGRQHSKLAKKF